MESYELKPGDSIWWKGKGPYTNAQYDVLCSVCSKSFGLHRAVDSACPKDNALFHNFHRTNQFHPKEESK